MKKLIPVFMAVILLLTGCAADGQRADGNGKVSGETASPMADPAVNVDIGMYIYDDDWEPLSGITAELYADNTEVGWARPTYSATADDNGKLELKAVAAGQRYTVELKGRDEELEARGAVYLSAGDTVSHRDKDGYIEISVPNGTEKLFLTMAVTDNDTLRCSYSSEHGFEDAERIAD